MAAVNYYSLTPISLKVASGPDRTIALDLGGGVEVLPKELSFTRSRNPFEGMSLSTGNGWAEAKKEILQAISSIFKQAQDTSRFGVIKRLIRAKNNPEAEFVKSDGKLYYRYGAHFSESIQQRLKHEVVDLACEVRAALPNITFLDVHRSLRTLLADTKVYDPRLPSPKLPLLLYDDEIARRETVPESFTTSLKKIFTQGVVTATSSLGAFGVSLIGIRMFLPTPEYALPLYSDVSGIIALTVGAVVAFREGRQLVKQLYNFGHQILKRKEQVARYSIDALFEDCRE